MLASVHIHDLYGEFVLASVSRGLLIYHFFLEHLKAASSFKRENDSVAAKASLVLRYKKI